MRTDSELCSTESFDINVQQHSSLLLQEWLRKLACKHYAEQITLSGSSFRPLHASCKLIFRPSHSELAGNRLLRRVLFNLAEQAEVGRAALNCRKKVLTYQLGLAT